ncbi:hypothetical protein [Inmirania thermothiophila]|nr:hypothetical protein [Inmirania thermothiophila]
MDCIMDHRTGRSTVSRRTGLPRRGLALGLRLLRLLPPHGGN